MEPSVWLIAGPTASGKSELALRLAETLDAEIVNADSMQIYAGLRVLTAAPGPGEAARRPHHLYGVADPADAWSVGRWLRATQAVLSTLAARGRSAVVVGGSGLYLRALTQGLAEIPAVGPEVRAAAVERLDRLGETAFRAELARVDAAAAARVAPGDRQRLVRAWSVAQASGRALSDWQADAGAPALQARHTLVVAPPREGLYARCDRRLEGMVGAGALDEVAALLARALSPELPAMKALGVREFAAVVQGRLALPDALALAQMQTRRYAKRQSTWFRNQTPDWPRIVSEDAQGQWLELRSQLTPP